MRVSETSKFNKLFPVKILIIFSFFAVSALSFSENILKIAPDWQFNTHRDGSEALILSKIFADANGIPTPNANLGFVQRPHPASAADVLAVYNRLDFPNAVAPVDLTDANWTHGIATFGGALLLKRATSTELGYASNELSVGQRLHFPNGQERSIINVVPEEKFVQIYFAGAKIDGASLPSPIHIGVSPSPSDYEFIPYDKQFGLAAVVLSSINRFLPGLFSIQLTQFVFASLCALSIIVLSIEYWTGLSKLFSVTFFICMIGSPWITAVAPNIYFAPFLWFLPSAFAIHLYNYSDRAGVSIFCYIGYFLAILTKSLCGYEYLSTIVLFSIFPFLVDPFRSLPSYSLRANFKFLIIIAVIAVSAFIVAFLLHAYIRSENFLDGIKLILADATKYSEVGGALKMRGYDQSLLSVLGTYIFSWSTPLFFWLPGDVGFSVFLFSSAISVLVQYLCKNPERHRDAAILSATFLAPLSWFVLQRGHSVIHVHLNYVLWYFGFIPAMVFVSARGAVTLVDLLRRVASRATLGHPGT